MPLVPYSLKLVRDVLKRTDQSPDRTGKILCLAHPDIIASRQQCVEIFGDRVANVPARPDGQEILNWHKAWALTSEVLDTRAFFAALGYAMDAIDITAGRGGEILHDLSQPLPENHPLLGQYDFVFDCISNQVFAVAWAWWTMLACCRPGGWMLSVTPIVAINQGFWNISPAAYKDFCDANGVHLEYRAVQGIYVIEKTLTLDTFIRQRNVPDDAMNLALMQKIRTPDVPVWPIMAKFQKYPNTKRPSPPKVHP